MMNNLQPIAEIIESRKRTFLDIGIFDDGDKKLINRKYEVDENWKKVLQSVFETYGVSEIWIDVYAGNGNSKVFVESVTVDKSMMNFQSPLPVSTAPLAGLGNLGNVPEQFLNYMLNDKEQKIKEKEDIIREMKDQHKIDLDTISKLQERNIELERNSKFKEKEFELNKREEEIEERSNRKSGLEGIYEQATSNPQVMEIVKMFVQSKLMPGQPYTPATPLSGVQDPFNDPSQTAERNAIAKYIFDWLRLQNDEIATKFYVIYDAISKKPALIDKLVKIIPGGHGE